MFSCKGSPPALVTLLVVLTGCCVARGSFIPPPVNGTSDVRLLNSSLVLSPTPTTTGCTNAEGLLESFGSIDRQLNLTTMAIDISGQVTYAFESTNRSLVRKVLSTTRSDGRDGRSGNEDWAFLSPSAGSSSLLGVISLSRGVAPPASSFNATVPGASAAPILLATLAGSHCIFAVTIDATQAAYSTSRYMGRCDRRGDIDGTFDAGAFNTPRYLVLTRSSTILFVVGVDAIRALNYASNYLSTPLKIRGGDVIGAFLSPDEQTLFLPLRDGKILRANVEAALERRSSFRAPLLLAAVGVGDGSIFVAFAAAVLGTGGQVARVAPTAGAAVAGMPCPEDRYVLATRSSLAVAIAGVQPTDNIPLNVTWSTNATVLCAAMHSDGQSLLVITSRDATDAGPAGVEYQLLTSSWARTVGRSPDLSAAPSSTNATTPVSASLDDTTVSSLSSSLSVTGVTDAEAFTDLAAATLVSSSAASQALDGNRSSSAAAAAATAAATAAVSEPAAAAPTAGRGSLVLSSGMDAYPAVAANDHVNVVLVSTISAGIACACLLAAGAYLLARRLRWSLLWKNRRLLVKLGPQGDDIILVPPGEYGPGSVAADGGYDCAVAVDCAKDPVVVSSVPQQQQQP